MKAIIEIQGKQFVVSEGDRLRVSHLPQKAQEEVKGIKVLGIIDDNKGIFSEKELEKVNVKAVVIGEEKGKKIRIFTYKPKKRYHRTLGHRDKLTLIEIQKISK
jgi:large subunit ribosomal protein L21